VADLERGTRGEHGDEEGDDRDVRGDDEVLDGARHRLIAHGRGEEPAQDGERRQHDEEEDEWSQRE